MKDEEFDELIRQKLESGSGSPAAPADVSRVMKYVRRKKGFPIKGGISRWLYFILPVATVVTFFAVVRNSDLQKSKLRELEQSAIPNDTISNIRQNEQSGDSIIRPAVLSKNEIIATTVPAIAGKTGKNVSFNSNTEKSTEKNDNISVNSIQINSNASDVINPLAATEKIDGDVNKNVEALERGVMTEKVEKAPEPSGSKISENDNQKVAASNNIIESQINQPEISIPDTSIEEANPIKHRTQQNPKIRSLNKNGIFKKTNEGEFKFGPSVAVFQHSYGFGLDAYRSVLKNTGIHAGFHYSVFQPEHFTNREDFDTHHHHGKPPPFDEHLQDDEKPVDIIVNNKALQFNIGITHYFRLKNNFSIPLSLGTNLDVKLWQNLNYRIENDSIRNNRFSFQTPEKATAFNNIYLSAGIEKSWRSLSFQVQPFLGYQFNTPGYRRFIWEPGIGASVFYVFGR